MPISVYIAAFLVMAGLVLLVFAVFGGDRQSATPLHMQNNSNVSMRNMRLQQNASDRVFAPMIGAVAGRARRFTPNGALDAMEHKINVAGVASTWTVERLIATKVATGLLGVLIGGYFIYSDTTPRNIVLGLVIAAGAYVVPDMSLDRRAQDRAALIEKSLPDVLDQMTIGVEAGLGFDAALMRVSQENEGPLAEEFGRMMQDRQLGMSREEAFAKVTERTDSDDLKHFVLAMTQAARHGMPLATVLRVQADEMRQKRRVRAEEKALSLPVKLVLPLVLCILPALFTVIIGPAVFRLSGGGLAG